MKTLSWKKKRSVKKQIRTVESHTQVVHGLLKVVGTVTFPFLIFFLYFVMNFRGLTSPDALDIAQIGRQIVTGNGITTSAISPVSLTFVPGDIFHYPELSRPPLYPLVVSGFFALFGATDIILPFCAGFFFILTAILSYHLGVYIGGKRTGWLSLFLVGSSPALLQSAVTGLEFVWLAFILLCLFWAVIRLKRYLLVQPALLGILAALCTLTDYAYLLLLVPLTWWLAGRGEKRRKSRLIAFYLSFTVVVLPWLIRNAVITGNPLFTLQYFNYKLFSSTFPGNSFFRSAGIRIYFLDFHPVESVAKAFNSLSRLYLGILIFTQSLIAVFFVAGIFWNKTRDCFRAARSIGLTLLGLLFLYISLTTLDLRELIPLTPLIIIGGVDFFSRWLDSRSSSSEQFIAWILIIFILLNSLPTVQRMIIPQPAAPPGESEIFSPIKEIVRPDEVIVSDNPWLVAWRGERTSIWIPWTLEGFKGLKSWRSEIKFLLLTPAILSYPRDENAKVWQEIYEFDMSIPLPGDGLLLGNSRLIEPRLRESTEEK